jgi:hypothetical protein
MCPPTSFSDHGTGASEKIRSPPRKTFFNSIDPLRHFRTVNCGIAKGSFVPDVEVSIFCEKLGAASLQEF